MRGLGLRAVNDYRALDSLIIKQIYVSSFHQHGSKLLFVLRLFRRQTHRSIPVCANLVYGQ